MENITKSSANIIFKKKPKTIIRGKSNIPIPDRMLTAIRKIKPTAKAFILPPSFFTIIPLPLQIQIKIQFPSIIYPELTLREP
jgi:hypothetical protein